MLLLIALLLRSRFIEIFYKLLLIYTQGFCLYGFCRILRHPVCDFMLLLNENGIEVPKCGDYLLYAVDLFKK